MPGTNHTISPAVARLTDVWWVIVGPVLPSSRSVLMTTDSSTTPAVTSAALTVWVQVNSHRSPGSSVPLAFVSPVEKAGAASQTGAARVTAFSATLPMFTTEIA